MGTVSNLNRFRKQKAREDKRVATSASAAHHGESKAQGMLTKAQADKAKRDLDGHKTE